MPSSGISVAMCTYNGAAFLGEELASMAAQTRRPDELVVCDDGSTDDTLAILEKYSQTVSFPVRIIRNQTNLGRTRNFEKVVGLCTKDLIALADFDDVWKPNKLEVLAAALESQPAAGYAFSDGEMIAESGAPLGRRLWQQHKYRQLLESGFPPEKQAAAVLRCGLATGATMMIRSAIREFVLPISPLWIQDHWISVLASLLGWHGIAVPESLIFYRTHAGQMTGLEKKTGWQRGKLSLATPIASWKEQLSGFEQMRDHIILDPRLVARCGEANLKSLEGKIRHLESRIHSRSAKGLNRGRLVISEALTGRYQRYSNSWQSVAQDLLF